ncbi:MAG: hypothetical protein JNL73_23615 [Anaerolineales bacterium]|nr:hypothetical protein [Anaerolineales bacterium]
MLAYATLLHLKARFPDLLAIVAEWLSARTNQSWNARRVLDAAVWKYPLLEVRTALAHPQDRAVWSLQLNTRDTRVPGRDWRFELALRELKRGGVQATVAVRASDVRGPSRSAPLVPFSQPALVGALLERGDPDPETPGLVPLPLNREADAQVVAARITDPRRAHAVVVLCRGETALDVSALRTTVTGLADVVDLRPVLAFEIATTLKTVNAWPPPGRATVFPPRAAMVRPPELERRQVFGAEARTLISAVLRLSAPRVLAEHVTVERLQQASGPGASDGGDV